MARVTIEDCLLKLDNAFDICTLAGKRAKDLSSGASSQLESKDKPTVIALREIAAGHINMDYFEVSNKEKIENQLFGTVTEEEVIDELSQSVDTNQPEPESTSADQAEIESVQDEQNTTDSKETLSNLVADTGLINTLQSQETPSNVEAVTDSTNTDQEETTGEKNLPE